MFGLESQAASIVDQLETITGIGTVAYIDRDDESGRQPATLPAAFLALDKLTPGAGRAPGTTIPSTSWVVMARAKGMEGPGGCLALIDSILDVLVGFHPATGTKPLQLSEVEYFEKKAESVAYAVRFSTLSAGGGR